MIVSAVIEVALTVGAVATPPTPSVRFVEFTSVAVKVVAAKAPVAKLELITDELAIASTVIKNPLPNTLGLFVFDVNVHSSLSNPPAFSSELL